MLAIKFIVEMVQGENGGLLFGNVNKRIKLWIWGKLNIFSIIDYDVIISTILPIILNENIEKMSIVCQREDNLMLIYIIQLLKILSMIWTWLSFVG